jgi:spore coat polysaccharide biosynthesis predicted glycosyltransferase SpsG
VAAGFSAGERVALRNARWLVVHTGLTPALLDADVAIVAGGVTLYETCAIGVPAVALAVVPAQRPAIRAFAAAGAVIDAGGVSAGRASIARAAAGVARLVANRRLRQTMTRRARQIVDGQGTARVAARIQALVAGGGRRCA